MAYATQSTVSFGDTWSATQHNVLLNNFIFLNTAFHVPLFPRSSGLAPSSGLQAAGYLNVQSSGAGTVKPEWPVLTFDQTTSEGRIWNDTIPRCYASTLVVAGSFYMPTVTIGTFTPAAQIACWSDTDATVTSKVMATVNTSSAITVPGTAVTIKAFLLTMTNADSAAAIDSFSLAFFRDISDTAAEDVYLKRLDLFFSLA